MVSATPNPYMEARAAYADASRNFEKFVESHGENLEAENAIIASVPSGLYEHWKSAQGSLKYYVVHGAGCEQDVHTPLVAYAALYAPHAGKLSFRHLLDEQRGFLSPVNREVYRGPRFRLIVKLTPSKIQKVLAYKGELMMIERPADFLRHVAKLLGKTVPHI